MSENVSSSVEPWKVGSAPTLATVTDEADQSLMYVRIDPKVTAQIERIEEKLDRLLASGIEASGRDRETGRDA